MSITWSIERLEVRDFGHLVQPGDASIFAGIHAAGRTGWYGPIREACRPYVEKLYDVLPDAPVTDHRSTHGLMSDTLCGSRDPDASWAIGALDCALWDLHGVLEQRPVADLLARGPSAQSVPVYGSWLRLDITEPANLRTIARTAPAWPFTKWSLSISGPADVDDLADAIERTAAHAGTAIALDGLRTWTPDLTRHLLARVDPSTLRWIEDPVSADDQEALRDLGRLRIPLASGEHLLVHEDPIDLLAIVRPDILTFDAVGCGGLTRMLDLIELARRARLRVFPHGRSLVPGLHLAAAFPAYVPAVEYQIPWEPGRQSLYSNPIAPRNGCMHLPAAPGLVTTPRSP